MSEPDIAALSDTPDLFDCWPEIERQLRRRRLALFLDYDGTLTPIVERPDRAVLAEPMRAALRTCAERWPTAVVSGRAREDVARLIGLPALTYAGSHGFDIAGPPGADLRLEVAADVIPVLADMAEALRARTRDIPGVLVEDKRFSVAVHVRLTPPERRATVATAVRDLARRDPRVRTTDGKMVFELRPAVDWDKGQAVRWLLDARRLGGPDVVPVFIGDDTTDEDAFRAIDTLGVTVAVMDAPRPTAARYAVRDVAAVQRLLERLAAQTPE